MKNDEITISQPKLLDSYETLRKVIAENFTDQGMLMSYDIVIDCNHALFVEYGTGPANTQDPQYDEFGRSVKTRIAEWVDYRFGNNLTPRQRQEMAYSVYKNIMDKGIKPSPFIRPAIDEVLGDSETIQAIFDSGGDPMHRLAEYIIHVMVENLYINDNVYLHGIENNISIRPGNPIDTNTDETEDL